MKTVSIYSTQPAKFMYHQGVTLFKGDKPEVDAKSQVVPQVQPEVKANSETQPQLKPQVQQDTVEISSKKPEKECTGEACKK